MPHFLWWMNISGNDTSLCNSSVQSAPQKTNTTLPPPLHTTIMLLQYLSFGGHSVWFWGSLNHLYHPPRTRFKPFRENDTSFFSALGCFPTVYRAFKPTPGFVFPSSVVCKNVILPYHDPNMQPFIQKLPVFIWSASVCSSATSQE